MPIGAYIYSQARNVSDAVSDARYVVSELRGYTISYPVAIDLEDSSQTDLSKAQLGAIAKHFVMKSGDMVTLLWFIAMRTGIRTT